MIELLCASNIRSTSVCEVLADWLTALGVNRSGVLELTRFCNLDIHAPMKPKHVVRYTHVRIRIRNYMRVYDNSMFLYSVYVLMDIE